MSFSRAYLTQSEHPNIIQQVTVCYFQWLLSLNMLLHVLANLPSQGVWQRSFLFTYRRAYTHFCSHTVEHTPIFGDIVKVEGWALVCNLD